MPDTYKSEYVQLHVYVQISLLYIVGTERKTPSSEGESMYSFIVFLPFIINIVLLFLPKSTTVIIIGLISTILGSVYPAFGLLIGLDGHGIGFGNPPMETDWGFIMIVAAERLFLWGTFIYRIVK